MKTMTITAAFDFLDSWNTLLGVQTPAHHKQIMRFLVDILNEEPHRGLLTAFRHSGKSTVVGIFAACVLYHKPETRILILSAESGLASRMVSHIKIFWKIILCVKMFYQMSKKSGEHIKLPLNVQLESESHRLSVREYPETLQE